ncbi:dipeptidase [Paenibacillus eucommiae]|uniref:Acetylornithine deacetylase/succinyl-diaminopimelate desuccinylase-like protein n=1 Tax=Paenibacillus eucommiae TaxID=1355755 RepID=A0ABS4IYV0_9BACL|nr:dipeptidase [Paenibacillus eucommiae]MBP1992764.1 acetylornithine deacetylase/succinyl-diaminopimelate desuccinylase-like protein [Paenibacillus eucommiae]
MINAIETYVQQHNEIHMEELKQLLRIPSISAVAEHKKDILHCAEWVAGALQKAGLEHVEIMATAGHPVVYADWLHAPGKPTVLVYGHYDVQPAEPLELWDTPPFEPTVRDGKIYARGATDDKGQLFLHIKAVESCLQVIGSLPVNIKFCIEGEEEIASFHLPPFFEQHLDKLQADVVTLSDTQLYGPGKPALMYGLRGLAAFEIIVEGANSDLHSGLYGGGVPNPIHALSKLLSSFHDEHGHVAVEGFYNNVIELSQQEREAFKLVEPDEHKLLTELGVSSLFGESNFTFYEQTTSRPTLEITSISGGFQGEGIKPIIPNQAIAKVACRLTAAQVPDEVMDAVEKHIHTHKPAGVRVRLNRLLRGNPFITPIDHPAMQAAANAYEEAYGTSPVYMRGGGSIPIVEVFGRLLQAPVVMLGFGLPGENLHAPNEHFHLENWHKGLSTICRYWYKIGADIKL